jgi:hypothetical protein
MRLMNIVLKPFIGKKIVVYLDEIIFFSRPKEDNLEHLDKVLRMLYEVKLLINLKKCEFMKEELVYLRIFIENGSFKMNPSKVEAIINWPPPKLVCDVKRFHGLARLYR